MDCGTWRPFLCSFSHCDVLPILVRCYQTHASHEYKMKDGNLRWYFHVQCENLSLPAGLWSPALCKQCSSCFRGSIHHLWCWYRNFSLFSCWHITQTWRKLFGARFSLFRLFYFCLTPISLFPVWSLFLFLPFVFSTWSSVFIRNVECKKIERWNGEILVRQFSEPTVVLL